MTTPYRIVALACLVLVTCLFATVGHAQSAAWQPLRDDPEIHAGLTVIAVGRHIENRCDAIDARMLAALAFAERLVDRAQELGFSRREVNAFIDDDAEQQRYREVMRAWFAQRGVDHRDREAVCAVGRDEIAAGSPIGRLLRRG